MSPVLYVTSDRIGAGKTALCMAIAHKLINLGKTVSICKPLSTESDNGSSDRNNYEKLMGASPEGWPLVLPENGFEEGIIEKLCLTAGQVKGDNDILIVEGLPSNSLENTNMIIEALDANLLSVVEYTPELSSSDLANWSKITQHRLVGLVINKLTLYAGTDLKNRVVQDLEKHGVPLLGVIPENRTLLGVSVNQLASYLGGKLMDFGSASDRLVENLMVGGNWMDAGEVHFGLRSNKAVVVRGDRPDIQMAALGTSTSCLVLTGGIEPIEYVRNEASEMETPIITVSSDTLSTMENISDLPKSAVFDHITKLGVFSELLESHIKLETIYRKLGAID